VTFVNINDNVLTLLNDISIIIEPLTF